VPQLLWDASALVKRYVAEVGSDTVDALFTVIPAPHMVCTLLGYTECAALLRRRFHQAVLGAAEFGNARLLLEQEIVSSLTTELVSIDDTVLLASVALIDQHNLNSSDAAILAAFLGYVRAQAPAAPRCVLVASDRRLLRAASAEGLLTLNPEAVPAADVPSLLASM
jgi:predicted nucleic acid-binding protein